MHISESLDWDSQMLGLKVAKLLPARLCFQQLQQALSALAVQGTQLVYWASDSQDVQSQQAAQACQGLLVDQKITYVCELANLVLPEALPDVLVYPNEPPSEALVELAYASGMYSRFKIDPNITDAQFAAIYRQWITNSTLRTIAQQVLVINEQNHPVAMVTLGEKQHRGDIGLLAVAALARGKGLGKRLVQAAQQVFYHQGYQQSQVVTQQANKPACALYERCGYTIEKQESFYHFWLRNER